MIAQDILLEKYGRPDETYQRKYCVIWQIDHDFPWFPAKRMMVNADFKAKLFVALKAIEAAGLQEEIDTFDGCYSYRKSRTTKNLSIHSWAGAWDLNAHKEPLGQKETNWSAAFIKCMTDAGIYWGGQFKGKRDNMHFALVDG